MTKFVMDGQQPTEFRKCKLDAETSEFCDGKKKNFILTQNSIQLHPEENLYQQSYYQGKSQLRIAGKQFGIQKQKEQKCVDLDNLNQKQIKDKFGMSKLQLKQFQKSCIALKVGIAKNREYGIVRPYEQSPVRQITSARPDKTPSKHVFSKLQLEIQTEDDPNTDFFSYLSELNVRPQSAQAAGPQFRGKKQYFVEGDRMDRIESDSRSKILQKKFEETTLKKKYLEKLNEKSNNSLTLRQHPTGHAKTDAGVQLMKYLDEYEKNKPDFKKHTIVQKGKKGGEMSSMYPPMFERARLTKKLYYRTAYQAHYPIYQGYLKPSAKFGTTEFKKTYRPILFNA